LQDEIMEFLEASPSALSDLLLTMHSQKMAEIAQRYEDNKKTRDGGCHE